MFSARTFRITASLGLLAGVSLLGGCVGQGEYDKLYETNRSLTESNSNLSRENSELRKSVDLLRGSNVGAEGTLADAQKQNAMLKSQLEQALANFRDLQTRIEGIKIGALDEATNTALKDLADKFPDLIKFDESRGMLRFASDLTFDSGSDAVKNEAKAAIAALAQVLSSGAASQYEIWIEGHTDSQKISGKTAPQHPTNRHLSAHRAISVIRELANLGVAPSKMMAAGWGEYRPLVPNTPTGNTPQNRRVEIYLTKSTATVGAPEVTEPTVRAVPDKAKPPTRQPDVTK